MIPSNDEERDAWARVLMLMALVDDHLDSDKEIPVIKDLLSKMSVPDGRIGELFFQAAEGWNDPLKRHEIVQDLTIKDEESLVVWLQQCMEVMDADGMRHQQEFVFISQVASKLKAGQRLNEMLFPAGSGFSLGRRHGPD